MTTALKKEKVPRAAKTAPLTIVSEGPVKFTPLRRLSDEIFDKALKADNATERNDLRAWGNEQRVREQEEVFWAAFAQMQPELPIIERKGKAENGDRDWSYGLYEDIVGEITPVLEKHCFGLSFKLANLPEAVEVTCILAHASGHKEQTSYPFPFDRTGDKNDNQAHVSAVSYGKRTLSTAMLNIVTRGQDDDAAATAASTSKISADQVAELKKLLGEAKRTEKAFLKFAKVATLADIRVAQFEKLKRELYAQIAQGVAA